MNAPASLRVTRTSRVARGRSPLFFTLPLAAFATLALGCSDSSSGGSPTTPSAGAPVPAPPPPASAPTPPPATEPELWVTPNVIFNAAGAQGGPFLSDSAEFVVRNVGGGVLDWSVSSTELCTGVSAQGGRLAADESTTITVSLDDEEAARLGIGIHTGSVDFVNDSNGSGTTSRGIEVDVFAASGLIVEPAVGFASSGPLGGPFSPASFQYSVSNTGDSELAWAAVVSEPGLDVSPAGGVLDAGGSQALTVTIDQTEAKLLPLGSHAAILFILDLTNGNGSTTRPMTVDVSVPSSGGTLASRLTQFGIEWVFDRAYEVGQFANGDWWVVGPVRIVNIDPQSTVTAGRTINGSMINPSPRNGMTQGYDSTMYAQYKSPGNYEPLENVAAGISTKSPLIVPTSSSLVSTVSQSLGNTRPQIETAAVLTVLDQAPPDGSFRPAYSDPSKRIRFNERQLDYDLLGKLPKLASTPGLKSVEQSLRRPWLDHVPQWIGRYIHPAENMPDYGRDMADVIGRASLALNLDFTDAEKRETLVSLVQLGIDFYGVATNGGANNWAAAAGHMSGRKWPILFAGIMLGDPDMGGIGFDTSIKFGEDGQTFYVEETSPGVFNNGNGGYTAKQVGLAEWGTAHSHRPSLDDADWHGDPYRLCCTANSWWGQILSARIMGAQGLWNHDELFDYQDRYYDENVARGILDYRLRWSRFPIDMWNAYRSSY